MSTAKFLTRDNWSALGSRLLAAGTRVVTPVRRADGIRYRAVGTADEVKPEPYGLPAMSLKEVFFPATEPLYTWERKPGGEIVLTETPPDARPTVVLGARPCDAAAVDVLDKVMGWDYQDEPWFARRARTTIVSLACEGPVDALCFCTTVGLGPDATRGSDVLLTAVEGGFHADVVTPKGQALVAAHADLFAEGGRPDAAKAVAAEARKKVDANLKVDPPAVKTWLMSHFEDPVWKGLGLRCHGCGSCAVVCPTCHCFDIVDEPDGLNRGVRRRNWDTCQNGKFTLHASGHNPREDQNARFRQRVMHKFGIYPTKFGDTLCTGCGRCARGCPGGADILEILGQVQGLIGAVGAGGAR